MATSRTKYRKQRAATAAWTALSDFLQNKCGIPISFEAGLSIDPGGKAVPEADLLSPEHAARRLGVSVKTLANWRSTGVTGLAFVRVGCRIFYRRADIDAFIRKGIKTSTSQT